MRDFYKWWVANRPVVLYYFWWVLMSLNLGMGILLTYLGKEYDAVHKIRGTVIWLTIMTIFSYFNLMFWSKYRWNPEEYAKLLKRRPRISGRRDAGTSSEEEREEKEDS